MRRERIDKKKNKNKTRNIFGRTQRTKSKKNDKRRRRRIRRRTSNNQDRIMKNEQKD